MSDIPADVMAAALLAHADYAKSSITDNLTIIIAKALIADRDRRQSAAVMEISSSVTLDEVLAMPRPGHLQVVPSEPEWQDISTAPRDGTEVLCYSPGNKSAHNECARAEQWRVDHWRQRVGFYRQYPEAPWTHWQPLKRPSVAA